MPGGMEGNGVVRSIFNLMQRRDRYEEMFI